ncbi:MAG: nitrogenase component 1, partial [Coriobacteriia bacterium]|nr:nitrogenase component 1 [Coriobacteriia bacterium]
FAVPVRREYANAVFLVTSGEYMAIYAANNILRGIRNFDGEARRRVAGIIYNQRNVADEDGRVQRFARAVGLPICAKVPRSNAFARAEEAKCTVMQLQGAEAEQQVFSQLAAGIGPNMPLYEARPLSDEELEEVVLGTAQAAAAGEAEAEAAAPEQTPTYICSTCTASSASQAAGAPGAPDPRPPANRLPLYGCAFNGAATVAVHLTDALVIAHSPKACAFYTWQTISSPGRKNLYNRGVLTPSAIVPHFECSNMGQAEAVFGGMELLENHVRRALGQGYSAIVVISSCVSGIIGDDVNRIAALGTPECPVIPIAADGDIAGDYMQGIRMCTETLARALVDPAAPPAPRSINIVGENSMASNVALNLQVLHQMLDPLDIRLNCRFLGDATVAEVRRLLAAPLNVMAADSADCRQLRAFLESEFNARFMDGALPVGFDATAAWLCQLGREFACEDAVERVVCAQQAAYDAWVARLRPVLAGKRVFLTTINCNIDWLLNAGRDVGMEWVYIGVANYLHQPVKISDTPERWPAVDNNYDWTQMTRRIRETAPDIVLSNYTATAAEGSYVVDAVPMSPVIGFQAALHLFDRWAELLQTKREGAWKNDRALFEAHWA